MAVPVLGSPVPAVAEVGFASPVAAVATVAAQRLAEQSVAEQALASVDQQLARLDQPSPDTTTEPIDPAMAEVLRRQRRVELLDERLEATVVLRAAELGHDEARRDLAVLVASVARGTDPSALDAVWARAQPSRLGVLYAALGQVGDPYVFNTAGPDRFDCSGLTLYAWQTAGVRLAHYSFTQRSQLLGTTADELQPGDLIFNLRSTGGHVMLSLGLEHLMVHAPAPGRQVEISRWRTATGFGSPFGPPASPPTALADAAPARVPAAAAGTASAAPSAAPVPTASAPPVPLDGAGEANDVGRRYGIDPAILMAVQPAPDPGGQPAHDPGGQPIAGLRPELVRALGADPGRPGSVLDATARYLVAANLVLGDMPTALAALDAGAGPASEASWPEPLQARVLATMQAADALRPAPAATEPEEMLLLRRLSSSFAGLSLHLRPY